MHSQPEDFDSEPSEVRRPQPTTFRQRHALKILGVIMASLFATVIIAQVAC
jgi:hypothetical protein